MLEDGRDFGGVLNVGKSQQEKPIGDRFLSKVRKKKDKRLNIRRDRYEENES
jgi:hypothetical protein